MKWALIIIGSLAGLAIITCVIIGLWAFGVARSEAKTRNLVDAKQMDNKNQLDLELKTQLKVCQLPAAQEAMLKNIIVGYANARASGKTTGSFINVGSVREVVPNVDTSMFNKIMNIIQSTGDMFALKQTELIDLNRAHTDIVTVPPSSWVCAFMGKGVIDIKIVTSSRVENAFTTGKDDDIDLHLIPAPTPAPAK